jgi:hypothetical protein
MASIISEIEQSYDKKIATLQQAIERLKAKKAAVIASLREDIGDQEIKPVSRVVNKNPPSNVVTGTDEVFHTIRERMLKALDAMPISGFGTTELFAYLNKDGLGVEIGINPALKVFKKLVDEGVITVLRRHSGKRGGVYLKASREQPVVELSSSPVGG